MRVNGMGNYYDLCSWLLKRLRMNDYRKLVLLFLVISFPIFGQSKTCCNYYDVLCLFQKSETSILEHRKEGTFEDPLGRVHFLYKTVRKESPELFEQTNQYKNFLLRILVDKTIEKDEYTDYDVVCILCNLCLDDYIEVMDTAYSLLKNKKINFNIFEYIIFQDFNMSNQVAQNYKNEKLQIFLNRLLLDQQFLQDIAQEHPDFNSQLKDLISGKLWDNELKEINQIQPPILKHDNCK